ncbi:MAG TPA: DUF3558 family protein [Candidatus Dormibacteraeota bacterium]|nr:DUF3558 family protein [Candidatus Dormibacteraeota bacterium]
MSPIRAGSRPHRSDAGGLQGDACPAMAAPRAALAAAALAAVLGLAGCGGGSSPSSAPTASSGSGVPRASAPPTVSSPAASPAPAADVCSLLPASTVASFAGIAVAGSQPRSVPDGSACDYQTPSNPSNPLIVVILLTANAAAHYQSLHAADFTPIAVSGVGDQAFADSSTGLVVLSGSRVIEVSGVPGQEQKDFSREVKLVQALTTALR